MTATPQQLALPLSAAAQRRAVLLQMDALERKARAADARGQWSFAALLRARIAAMSPWGVK